MHESDSEWTKRVLDSKSKSFCGAKWYNATIWLGSGATASCCLTPAHAIDVEEVKKNPSAIHNTLYKKLVRKELQDGVKSQECDYCWRMEDLDQVSDRCFKSKPYSEEDLQKAYEYSWDKDVAPQILEIAFDSNCNFACSYCNAGFSTKWAHDIKTHGPYQNLISDGWGAFASGGSWSHPYGMRNEGNPFVKAFWEWWDSELQDSLHEIRVTGGEATMSPDWWKLVAWFEDNTDTNMHLSVNTNLGISDKNIDRLIALSNKYSKFNIFTSNESFGVHAEYIRHGLDWDNWSNNLERLLSEGKFANVHCTFTINALCLASFTKIHEYLISLRKKYPDSPLDWSYNVLRFPSFQSIVTLPEDIRMNKADELEAWYENNHSDLNERERTGFKRTLKYIRTVTEGHDYNGPSPLYNRQVDFYNFYNEYDRRRGLNFRETFSSWPEMLVWYEEMSYNNKTNKIKLIDGGFTNMLKPTVIKTISNAKKDGLI